MPTHRLEASNVVLCKVDTCSSGFCTLCSNTECCYLRARINPNIVSLSRVTLQSMSGSQVFWQSMYVGILCVHNGRGAGCIRHAESQRGTGHMFEML